MCDDRYYEGYDDGYDDAMAEPMEIEAKVVGARDALSRLESHANFEYVAEQDLEKKKLLEAKWDGILAAISVIEEALE